MKKLIATFVILLLCNVMAGQGEKENKRHLVFHEISVNLINLTYPSRPNGSFFTKPSFGFLNGIMLKHYNNKNGYRLSFDYNYSKFEHIEDRTFYYSKDVGKNDIATIGFGYERLLGSKKLKPYVFSDITASMGDIKGRYGSWGDFQPVYTEFDYNYSITEIGVGLGFGLKYAINNKLSLNIESNLELKRISHIDRRSVRFAYGGMLKFNPINRFTLNWRL